MKKTSPTVKLEEERSQSGDWKGCAQKFRRGLIRDEVCRRHASGDTKGSFGFKGSCCKERHMLEPWLWGKVVLEIDGTV